MDRPCGPTPPLSKPAITATTGHSPESALRNTCQCKDGIWVMIGTVIFDRYYPIVCRMIGHEDLIDDPRFFDQDVGKVNAEAFVNIMDEVFKTKTYDEWAKLLIVNDISFDRINHFSYTLQVQQAWDNGFIYHYTTREGKEDITIGTPIKSGASEPSPHRNAPLLGEHSVELLNELGYSESQIAALGDQRVTIIR